MRYTTFVSITLLAVTLLATAACNRGKDTFAAGEPNRPLTAGEGVATSESAGARTSAAATPAGSPPASDSKYPGPPGYEKLAPAQFGKFVHAHSFSNSPPNGVRWLEAVSIFYNYADRRYEKHHHKISYSTSTSDVRVVITKFPSEAEARALVEEKGANSVPAADYDKEGETA